MKHIIVSFIFIYMMGCSDSTHVDCTKDLKDALAKFKLQAAEIDNNSELKDARIELKSVLSDCDVPDSGINIPMLGTFYEWNFYIYTHNFNKLKSYFKIHGINFNSIDMNGGSTPLHEASYFGTPEMIEFFLHHGMNVDVRDNFGNTPLMSSIDGVQQDFANTKLLLEKGSKINLENYNGISALDYALIMEDKPSVEFLLERGARIDCESKEGYSTIDILKKINNKEIENLLIKHLEKC